MADGQDGWAEVRSNYFTCYYYHCVCVCVCVCVFCGVRRTLLADLLRWCFLVAGRAIITEEGGVQGEEVEAPS